MSTKRLIAIPASLVLTLLVGCTALGVPTAQSFNEKMIVGYSTVTAVRTTATQLLVIKKISASDGENVLVATDAAKVGLDTAREIAKTDQTAAESKLNSIRTVLTALSTYLASRSK